MTTDDLYDAVLAHLDGDDALWALDELATRARGLRTTLQLIDDACRRAPQSALVADIRAMVRGGLRATGELMEV